MENSTTQDTLQPYLLPTEMAIKAYAKHIGKTEQCVNGLIRAGRVKWRYLYPETKEYKVIDSSFVFSWEKKERKATVNDLEVPVYSKEGVIRKIE